MQPKTEADLIAGLRAGDDHARRALFEREGERVWSLVYRLTGDYDLAQDVVQEAFITAYRKIARFEGRGSLRGWLCRVAVNRARDAMRTERRRSARTVPLEANRDRIHDTESSFDTDVHSALAALAYDMRVVVVMHDVEGYSHEEIGAALGIASGSSRARLSRGRALLRQMLESMEVRD